MNSFVSSIYSVYQGVWRPLFAPTIGGENVFDREWDLLIVLDGCRVDALNEVFERYIPQSNFNSIRSVGSQSKEWLAKTFTPEHKGEISNTAYITANPFTENVFRESENQRRLNPANWKSASLDEFGQIHELWRTAWDNQLDTVPPDRVTDVTISVGRSEDFDRVIVHYMQPHEPFISDSDDIIRDVWQQLRDGTLELSKAKSRYRDNLRYVLESVELLLSNFNAESVAITSDHGNAFGEWGIYGHPIGFQHPSVKRVPWVTTKATDDGEYSPSYVPEGETISDETLEDRLEALGYR